MRKNIFCPVWVMLVIGSAEFEVSNSALASIIQFIRCIFVYLFVMKRFIYNIVAISMIIVMLFAVIGLQLHYHTCGMSGERTFQLTDTPKCGCEVEVTDSCCENEGHSNTSCHDNSVQISNKLPSYDLLSCCQDNILDVTLVSSFINSSSKALSSVVCFMPINGYFSLKQRYDEYRNHLSKLKLLLILPRDISLEIIVITHLSLSLSNDHITL